MAGFRIVTLDQAASLPGNPYVYVAVNLTDDAQAADVEVELKQTGTLQLNRTIVIGLATWSNQTVIGHPTAQGIREQEKDLMDRFLNDWLSVNPKS